LPCRGTLLVSRHPLAPNTYLLDLYAARVEGAAPANLLEPGHPTSPPVSEHHDPAQLLRLAQRLLTSSVAYDQAPEIVQLYPGTLPLGLDDLPLPPDARIFGGMTSPLSTLGLVETSASIEATLDFYRAALPTAGWIAHDLSLGNRFHEGGFAHWGSETRRAYGRDEQSELTIDRPPGGASSLRAPAGSAELERDNPCAGWRAQLAYRNPRLRRPVLGDAALRHPQARPTGHLHAPTGGRRTMNLVPIAGKGTVPHAGSDSIGYAGSPTIQAKRRVAPNPGCRGKHRPCAGGTPGGRR